MIIRLCMASGWIVCLGWAELPRKGQMAWELVKQVRWLTLLALNCITAIP